MIDHREGNQVDVHVFEQPASCDALSIDEDQSLFGQQTAQVNYDTAVTAIGDVLVDSRAQLLWQFVEQVCCVAHIQPLDVLQTIRVHRVRSDFFRGWNVRAGHNYFLGYDASVASCLCRGRWILRDRYEDRTKHARRDRKPQAGLGGILHANSHRRW